MSFLSSTLLRRRAARFVGAALLSACVAAPAGAVQFTVTVPGTANLFGAGQATLPAPEGNGAGTVPILVTLPAGTGRYFRVLPLPGW